MTPECRETYRANAEAVVRAATPRAPAAIVLWSGEPGPKRLEMFARIEDAREYARANGGEVIRISGAEWHGEGAGG